MRSAYLDEAGIDNPTLNPSVVVAGVVLHTDTLWHPLQKRFEALRDRLHPEMTSNARQRFVFHAMDIWHGAREWDRNTWTLDARMQVISELCGLIREYDLPVVWGHTDREAAEEHCASYGMELTAKHLTELAFTVAFWRCAIGAQKWMDAKTQGECMNLVVEQNNELHRQTKIAFHALKDESFVRFRADKTRITKIIDAPSFMNKRDAPPLQLADLCAFLIKRAINHDEKATELLRPILPSIFAAYSAEEVGAELAASNDAEEPKGS